MKRLVAFSLLLVISTLIFGCSLEEHDYIEISPGKNGKCSEKLVGYMADQYGLYIPENADYVGGYCTNSQRDPSVVVVFDIELSQWEGYRKGMSYNELFFLFSHGIDLYSSASYDIYDVKRLGEEFGRAFEEGVSYLGVDSKGYSYLVCSNPADTTVSFLFRATGCGNPFS